MSDAKTMVVLAVSRNHAMVDLVRPLGANPKDFVIVTSVTDYFRNVRGRRNIVLVFLDGWWHNWRPDDAQEVYASQWYMVEPDSWVVEQADIRRMNFARALKGLPETSVPEFTRYSVAVVDECQSHVDDPRPMDIGFKRWQEIRELLDRSEGSLLPGLQDKRKREVHPFLAEIQWAYPQLDWSTPGKSIESLGLISLLQKNPPTPKIKEPYVP